MLEEVVGLQRLVDDLLHLARADAGAEPIVSQPVDLDDLVLRDARRLQAESAVEVDVSAVTAAQVAGDPSQLARAVANLGDNAVRHATSRVTFSLAGRRPTGRCSQSPTTVPACPPSNASGSSSASPGSTRPAPRAAGGTGLGLAIARDIVERHGGTITVDPDVTSGARFVIELPLADTD